MYGVFCTTPPASAAPSVAMPSTSSTVRVE